MKTTSRIKIAEKGCIFDKESKNYDEFIDEGFK